MAKVVMLSCDEKSRERFLETVELPVNYMADFSLMGFLVDKFDESLDLLRRAGFSCTDVGSGVEIGIHGAAAVGEIQTLLGNHGIACEFSDIADTIYQA